jgi:hypothetical protein
MGNVIAVTMAVGASVGMLGWVFLQYGRPDIYAQAPLWVWGMAALLVPLHLLRSLLMQVLSAVLRIKEVNIIEVVAIFIQIPLLVVLMRVPKSWLALDFL